jgi:DNA-3-methyladenine glycosylase
MTPTLPLDFYNREPTIVARELLGTLLVRRSREGTCIGRIVETEAYLSCDDTACHSHRGRNRKNRTMFGPPGRLYVYSIHARYCMNAVTEGRNVASAVLIRAVEPVAGIVVMQNRRSKKELLELTRGPARLCEAFGVDREFDGWNLTSGVRIWIAESESSISTRDIGISPRIGVTSAHEHPLRFFLRNNPFVSGPKSLSRLERRANASSI